MPDVEEANRQTPPGLSPVALVKASAEALDAWINLAIKIGFGAIVICVLFWPSLFPLASRFAFKPSSVNILGINVQLVDLALTNKDLTIDGDGSIKIKGHDINNMPDEIDKLKQSISDLTTQDRQSKTIIDNLNAALTDAGQELKRLHAQLEKSAPAEAAGLKDVVNQALASAKTLGQDVQANGAQSSALQQQAQLIADSVLAYSATGFGIVFSGDNDPPSALHEIARAPRDAAGTLILYKRQKSWRSVAYYATKPRADEDLPKFRKTWPQAYVVNLSSWCPNYTILVHGDDRSTVEQKDCGF